MECVACRASGLNGTQCVQTPVVDISVWTLHDCLEASHMWALERVNWIGLDWTRDLEILTRAFMTYVRPILQYNSTTRYHWHHYSTWATTTKVHQTSPWQRLQKFGLCSLESRRLIIDLVTCYKIVFGLTCSKCEEFFTLSSVNTTRGHSYKL